MKLESNEKHASNKLVTIQNKPFKKVITPFVVKILVQNVGLS